MKAEASPMYGQSDNYGSPASDAFGDDDLAEIDAVLDADDEEEDEYGAILGIGKGGGVLGIALGEKAQRNKIERILGKLKKFYEQGKLDKAQRYAKSLSKVNLIQKKGYTTPEIAAWVDFAQTGDEGALSEALEGIAWTGDTEIEDDESDVQGEVYDAGGEQVRSHRGPGRKLPPGFRPRGYSVWAPVRKARWLRRHPRAASVRLPVDPGPMPGRGRRGGAGTASSAAGVRGGSLFRPVIRPKVVRPVVRPSLTSSVRPFSPRPPAPRPAPAPYARPARAAAYNLGASTRPGSIRSAFRAGRASRYGLEDAVEEGVQEFGAMIGADAFRNLQGKATLDKASLFEDDMDDEIEGIDSDEDLDLDDDGDDDEYGAYIASYGGDEDDDDDDFGAYVPQFGAVFRRDIDERLESARKRYERLRAKETDEEKVQEAWQDYQRLVKALQKAAELPTAQRSAPSLARAWGRQVEDAGSPEDYAEPEETVFRLGGRVADADLEDDLDDLDEAV
jgi:hypothetical protein